MDPSLLHPPMLWAQYFQRRKTTGRLRLLVGVPSALLCSAYVLGFVRYDPYKTHTLGVPIDPTLLMIGGSLASGALGYAFSASAASAAARLFARKTTSSNYDMMNKIFFRKISYYRAERQQATSTSAVGGRQNRPDYYGEGVKSVAQYRDWLRRQRKVVVLLQANGDTARAQLIKPYGKWISKTT